MANDMLHTLYPEIEVIAEDVSGMPTLCRPVKEGGVGFDARLGMSIPDLWVRMLRASREGGRDLHSFTLELNLSNSRTHS
jgi:1,4-alpha-glucan branching enzyme